MFLDDQLLAFLYNRRMFKVHTCKNQQFRKKNCDFYESIPSRKFSSFNYIKKKTIFGKFKLFFNSATISLVAPCLDTAKLVLNLLQALALRLRQYENCECNAGHAAHPEEPEGSVRAEDGLNVAEVLGQEESKAPTHAHRDSRRLGFHVGGKHLAHNAPWQWAPSHAVRYDEHHQ